MHQALLITYKEIKQGRSKQQATMLTVERVPCDTDYPLLSQRYNNTKHTG